MSASEVATHFLVLTGITDSGAAVVDRVMLDCFRLSTSLSFHHIESFAKFTAEELLPADEQTVDTPGRTAEAPSALTAVQEETTGMIQQWEDHGVAFEAGAEIQPEQHHDMTKPVASSEFFERKRTGSLVDALLSGGRESGYKVYVQFVSPSGATQVVEACGNEEECGGIERSVESVIGRLLFTLSSLKMSNPDRHEAAVRRLQDLEEELRAAGAVCPPDETASNAVSRVLASASPSSDIQICVNSSRHITTTKSVFETETPGMEGLDAATVQHLQQQLISNMSQICSYCVTCSSLFQWDLLMFLSLKLIINFHSYSYGFLVYLLLVSISGVPEACLSSTEPCAPVVTDQKHESVAEGFTSEDGSMVVSKKMTRVVTTTRSTFPGEKAESNAGDLIRLKVNEQVYSGSVDPGDQHIHLVPITQQERKLDSSEQQQQ